MKYNRITLAFFLVSSTCLAGRVGGKTRLRDTVLANRTDAYVMVFEGKEAAMVQVSGDGSTDLDCDVLDNEGHLIDSDVGPSDTCILTWTPAWTGKFKIRIKNLGQQPNEYLLQTN
jgi:hypothetical protein